MKNKTNNVLLGAFSLMFVAASAVAQQQEQQTPKAAEGQTKIKVEEAADKKNKVAGDLDEEITNARMRAESGSKSKLSLSSSLSYTGGSLSRPFGKERPDLVGTPGTQTRTSGDVGLDARYRFSKNVSATLGTSFGLMTPFHGDMDQNENQLNVFDPSVGVSYTGKLGKLQASLPLSVSAGTSQESQGIDKTASVAIQPTVLHGFQNGLTAGLSLWVAHNFYSNQPGQNRGTAQADYYGGDKRTLTNVGIYPFAEYEINDTFQLRTVFGYFNWRHLYGDDKTTRLLQTYVYQSVGVGMAVTRDIYLYPNVQFVPDNLRSDFTNVALSATINMF